LVGVTLKVEIIRNATLHRCGFKNHFRNFENTEVVKQIFGDKTAEVLSNLEIEFTDSTVYMSVDYDARLLINPCYLESASLIDIYLDVIHELVHVRQVLNGRNCNHDLPYVERPLEIEAYRITVNEAKALGLNEDRIVSYLESDLINDQELRQLTGALGISCGTDPTSLDID
jgi:hypothetical protein